MLELRVVVEEQFDESTNRFIERVELLELEHSLATLSRWESKWQKPFLSKDPHTDEEIEDYFRMMVVHPESSMRLLNFLSVANKNDIVEYIQSKHTATWFSETKKKTGPQETVTAEVLYYQMFSLNIDISAEHWHLNKLLTLIEVFARKNAKPEKKSKAEMAEQHRKLNEERRKKYGTSG